VVFDYDNDGDLDLYIANQNAAPNLYRNERVPSTPRGAGGPHGHASVDHATRPPSRDRQGAVPGAAASPDRHWLMVKLLADPAAGTNRDAVGARVTLVNASGTQIRERDGGNGYCGQSDPRLHFGLGHESRVKLLEVRWPDGGLQYLEDVPADQVVTVRQDPQHYARQMAVSVPPPKPYVRPQAAQPERPPITEELLERLLADMEQRLRDGDDSFTLASTYRAQCAEHDRHDRSIDFLKKLTESRADDVPLRIQLACAYVDKIPTCGGMAAIVSKGTLARKSLDLLDPIVAAQPDLWVARYARGMNHLHWPRALRHSDDAAADLTHCLKLQARAAGPPKDYYLRTHVALGDAYTKADKPDLARRAWREALKLFPDSPELKARLAVPDDAKLLKYVERQRNLEQPIDTDLSFLDRER